MFKFSPTRTPGVIELIYDNPLCTRFADKRCPILVVKGPPKAPAHGWDGNEEAPTITPSIGCESRGCAFHGHLTAGKIRKG